MPFQYKDAFFHWNHSILGKMAFIFKKALAWLWHTKMRQQFSHFYQIFITCCPGSCQNDNFQGSKWWPFHQNHDILMNIHVASTSLPPINHLHDICYRFSSFEIWGTLNTKAHFISDTFKNQQPTSLWWSSDVMFSSVFDFGLAKLVL